MSNYKILALSFFAVLLAPLTLVADSHDPLPTETIVDVNFEFLMSSPKTNWGPDLFKKKAGFSSFTTTTEKFALQGIFYDKSGSMAVIGGKVVHNGEKIGSRTIAEIGPNFVVLEKGDSQIQVVLPTNKEK